MRFAVSMVMMAALAGCASVEDPFLTGSVSQGGALAPALTEEVPVSRAVAGLTPVVGAPRSVRQTAPGGETTIRQEIVYANATGLAGENVLIVEGGVATDGRYRNPPAENRVKGEMGRLIPGVPMRISPVTGENAHGVYSYATGPYGKGACLYGWQATARDGYPAQIRLRFCDERISEERIPMLMQSLTLRPLTGGTIAALRATRGPTLSANASLAGADSLFDVPARPAATAPRVAKAAPVASAPAPQPVSQPTLQPIPKTVPFLAPATTPLVANAVTVPMPGQKATPVDMAAAAPPPAENPVDLKQKAADAWAAARARLSGGL